MAKLSGNRKPAQKNNAPTNDEKKEKNRNACT